MTIRRGRPPKEKFQYPMASLAPAKPTLRATLQVRMFSLPCVAKLTASQKQQLHLLLTDALDDYSLVSELNAKRKSLPGNKSKAHVSLLIYRCAIAWCEVLGLNKTSLWEAPCNTIKEPPPVELARMCIEIATGKAYVASLRQQFKGAAKWSSLPVLN